MRDIRHILNLDQWPDLVAGPNGYAAKRRTDIAPLAYEILVNRPLRPEMIDKMVDFAGGADVSLVRELFSLCNGVRIGATKFAVYGVLGQIDRESSDVASHPPLDINIPNIYGRPGGWPDEYLMVGSSRESRQNQKGQKLVHAITPDGRIVVAGEEGASNALREYKSAKEWLAAEVDCALHDTTRY